MAASKQTVDEIIKILLKHVDRKTAIRLTRDLHNHVKSNLSVVETFRRIAERLVEKDD